MRGAVARPLGAMGGPLVGGFLTVLCRALNAGRQRPLSAAERDELAHAAPRALLDAVRIVEDARLPIAHGFAAITLGRTVYVRGRSLAQQPGLLAHEVAHVAQFARLGWRGMMASYGTLWLLHGYQRHPLEHEAREAERAALARREARRAGTDAG